MKLSQGEYVALEKIENVYETNQHLAQVYVHGDSLRDHLVGIVVPEPIPFATLVSKVYGKPVSPEDNATLADATKDPKVIQLIMDEMAKEAKRASLKGYVS